MNIYACGITDSNCDWVFQGVVVAENAREAKKELVKFKKEQGLVGASHVNAEWKNKTKRKKGVYEDTYLE